MSSPADRFRQRAAARQFPASAGDSAGGAAPFASFLERHEERQRKSRNKRRMLIVSVAVHVVVFGFLLLLSAWKVEELFLGTTVEVKMLEPADEALDAEGKPKRVLRTHLGRAAGLRLVATPQGAYTQPRTDLEPVSLDLRDKWHATLSQQLLSGLRYPDAAKPLRLRGSVTVLFDVNDKGEAQAINVKAPCQHPLLCAATQAAVASVRKWPVGRAPGLRAYAVSVDFRFD